jgi:hypothetical protein
MTSDIQKGTSVLEQERTITLRDLDVTLTNGAQFLTLYPDDTLNFRDNGDIEVQMAEQPNYRRKQETVVIRGAFVQSYSLRARQVPEDQIATKETL